jgi:para-nitrobenzyl esterase
VVGDCVLPEAMLDMFFAARQHPVPVMIGSNSDEASVMAVFGIDLAGQIQKLRRERRFGLGLIKLLYPGVKGMRSWAGRCVVIWLSRWDMW